MKRILCKIDKYFTIELRNVRETYGHDDSTPFNADIYAYIGGKEKATYVGYAYNDGWGGESTITCENNEVQPILQAISNKIRKMVVPYTYRNTTEYLPASLDFLIDLMVESCLYKGMTEYPFKENFIPKQKCA